MDARELLETLGQSDELPLEEVAWADRHRDELVPVFLDRVRGYLEGRAPEDDTPLLIPLAFLASWGVKDAYRPIAELLRGDSERLEDELGVDGMDLAPRFLRSVFDGDPKPIVEIVESETADELVRAEMLLLLATLAHEGQLGRAEIAEYLKTSFATLRPQEEHAVWVGWTGAVAALGLTDLTPLAEQAFDRRFVDARVYRRYGFRDEVRRAARDPDDEKVWSGRSVKPFGPVAEELGDWHFGVYDHDESEAGDLADGDGEWDGEEADLPPVDPIVNLLRHVGRNDPCPCGSGKKYKKCCLPKHEQGA
jgi:hypothetical protein